MAAFIGTLIHTPLCAPSAVAAEPHPVEILRDHCLLTNSAGNIVHVGPSSGLEVALQQHGVPQQCCHYLTPTQFLLPGFVDTHFHAPQYRFMGTGTDLPLFDWLNTYTFPAEARLKDVSLAEKLYTDVVNRLLRLGKATGQW
jgi:guanine deaminase